MRRRCDQFNAVAARREVGQDGDGDLGRRPAAERQADRAVQAVDIGVAEVEQLEAFAALAAVGLRTDGADVEGIRLQRFDQREIVELGIVRRADDRRARVGAHGDDRSSGISALSVAPATDQLARYSSRGSLIVTA